MKTEHDSTVRYKFGPLERRGLVAGWRGGQIATMGGALLVAVVVVRVEGSLVGVLSALVVVGLALVIATWPVAGRTLEEWAPDAVRYLTSPRRRSVGRVKVFSDLEILSAELNATGDESGSVGPGRTQHVGIVVDADARTYTTVFRAADSGFVLAGDEEKVGRVGAWASVLSSLAKSGPSLHRLQWVVRSIPGARPADEHEMRREVLVSLGVHARDASRRSTKHSTASGGRAGATTKLMREAASLRRQLRSAGFDASPVLSPDDLARAIRSSFASYTRAERLTDNANETRGAAPWPWPTGTDVQWDRLVTDETCHATFWISEWPRTDVGPDFLCPLLLASGLRFAMTVVMEPVSPVVAARKIEQSRTADVADSELRHRGGFLATARRHKEEENLAKRESELAEGHGLFRFAGYVTVSVDLTEDLRDACSTAEQAAARCGLELRLCYGDQARAFLTTLPLCRGLS